MLLAAILYAANIVILADNLHPAEAFLPEKLGVQTA